MIDALPLLALAAITLVPLGILIFGWPRKGDDYPHEHVSGDDL